MTSPLTMPLDAAPEDTTIALEVKLPETNFPSFLVHDNVLADSTIPRLVVDPRQEVRTISALEVTLPLEGVVRNMPQRRSEDNSVLPLRCHCDCNTVRSANDSPQSSEVAPDIHQLVDGLKVHIPLSAAEVPGGGQPCFA